MTDEPVPPRRRRVHPDTARRFAETDEQVCWDRLKLVARAWFMCPTKAPEFARLYCEYCTAKEEWHAAAARAWKLKCEAKGERHLRRNRVTENETAIRKESCDHGVTYDAEAGRKILADWQPTDDVSFVMGNPASVEIRKRWPRLFGPCPRGCGFNGIAYASYEHMHAGDW